uniref:C2H2-type domain-containing protein n=1 Tax=Panagrolaimus sp. ES5 TaxID=591445 RepID=A0AC34GTW6_9BILA
MGRKRKDSEELARPRQVVAPVQPLNSRPRRTTKDAFYNNLSTLTATRKTPIEDEMFFEEKVKAKPKKEAAVDRKSSSSTDTEALVQQRPVLVKQEQPQQQSVQRPVLIRQQKKPANLVVKQPKPEVVRIPISSSSGTQRSTKANDVNGLHHFIADLRHPHFTLFNLDIQTLSIDPRMEYSCNLCSRRFPSALDLNEHLSQHVENVKCCALCEKPSQDFTISEYTEHVASHFLIENNQTTCIFCGEISGLKHPAELCQHLLYYCPSIRYCFLCESEIEENKAIQHRRKHHTKLLNRYVCSTCFLGFPSLSPFLSHICDMRYRCLCEMTDVFLDHHSINKHIDECEEVELQYHGVLIPEESGRKRCFFVNPHSIMPSTQNIPSTYGFCEGKNPPAAAVSTIYHAEESVPETSEVKTPFPSSFAVPGSSKPPTKSKSLGNRYFRKQPAPINKPPSSGYQSQRLVSFLNAARASGRLSYPREEFPQQQQSNDNNPFMESAFNPFPTGKPIYRPLKQQPAHNLNLGPRLISQHSLPPRVIYPRQRMVSRIMTPNDMMSPYAAAQKYLEENVLNGIKSSTNRVSEEEEEENETIPPKRPRSTPSNAEPEVITL